MKLFAAFSRAYPGQSALVLGALVLASLFEGLGLTTLLPLLTTRVSEGGAGASTGIGGTVTRMLAAVGLTPTVGVLLSIVVIGMVLKSVLGARGEQAGRLHGRPRSRPTCASTSSARSWRRAGNIICGNPSARSPTASRPKRRAAPNRISTARPSSRSASRRPSIPSSRCSCRGRRRRSR
jgi:hypothetical protein